MARIYLRASLREKARAGQARDGAVGSPKPNKSGQGFRKRVCNLTRLHGAVTEERGKFSSGSTSEDKYAYRKGLSEEKFDACATLPRQEWLERRTR